MRCGRSWSRSSHDALTKRSAGNDLAPPNDIRCVMTPEVASVTESFDSFYRSQHDQLVRLAHLLTGRATVAEELVQEALLATHQRWGSLDNPAGYVRGALVNLC